MNMNQFPDPIISEILIRLPVQDISRFKIISKRWYSIISHLNSIRSHFSRSYQPWLILNRPILFSFTPGSGSDSDVVSLDGSDPTENLPAATKFDLIPRPGISTLTVNPFLISDDQPVLGKFPGQITGSSHGLVVGSFEVMQETKKYHGMLQERNCLFVSNTLSGEWVYIPQPEFVPTDMLFGVAIISRVDPGNGSLDKFLVVEYQHLLKSNTAILQCFSSDTGKWVTKNADYMLPPQDKHPFRPYWGFEFDGRLFWVEFSAGLITWDVKGDIFEEAETAERGNCRLIPVPKGRETEFTELNFMQERRFGGVAGGRSMQYVELFKEGDCWFKCWRLKDYKSSVSEWSLVYNVSRVDVGKYMGWGLIDFNKVTIVDLHPCFEPDSCLFWSGKTLFSFNFRTKVVEWCARADGFADCFPVVLPLLPTSIPPRLYAMNANEEGNEYFKEDKLTKAIKCYTKSIDLFPTVVAYVNRAKVFLKVNNFCEAEDDCTQALKMDNSSYEGYARRAIARKELGNLEGSKEDAERALKLNPKDQEDVIHLHADLKSMPDKSLAALGSWDLYMVD